MAGYRIDRINEEIARALSELIRGLKDPRISGLVSIPRVDTARDLGCAKVYISCFGEAGETIKGLKSAAGYLRRELSRAVDLRAVPELRFLKDDSLDEGSRILSVMNDLASSENDHE